MRPSLGTPILVQWSPTSVCSIDGATGQRKQGASLGDCLAVTSDRRELIVGIEQRSAFIRKVPMPNVPRAEAEKLLAFKLVGLLPLAPTAYISGFRLAHDLGAKGGHAVVGVVKAESLRRIYEEAEELGYRVRIVVPLAFGAWLAARSQSLNECVVVEQNGETLSIDVVSGGELAYSRTVPAPESETEFQEEIERTLRIAEIPNVADLAARVLGLGSLDFPSIVRDPCRAIEHLSDLHQIEKLLFTMELRERVAARMAKSQNQVASRALVTAIAATVFAAYALHVRSAEDDQATKNQTTARLSLQLAQRSDVAAQKRLTTLRNQKQLIDLGFRPAQKFSEMIAVLAADASQKSWFTGLTLERGKPVVVHGEATAGQEVAHYMAELAHEPRFREMRLIFANSATIGNKPIVQFAISGHAVGNLPIDQILSRPHPTQKATKLATKTELGGAPKI